MQCVLLVMCLVFRARQHAAGLDDFGRPLHSPPSYGATETGDAAAPPPPSTPVLEAAVGDAVHGDVRVAPEPEPGYEAGEAAPLLPKQNGTGERRQGLFGWLKR